MSHLFSLRKGYINSSKYPNTIFTAAGIREFVDLLRGAAARVLRLGFDLSQIPRSRETFQRIAKDG